ncbi:hypothetical protein DFH06DRAFT_1465834 [Mycena polygramma]|nr:hypothetical protein DFH06DRAFT_1465834 [Mycena polygramma]
MVGERKASQGTHRNERRFQFEHPGMYADCRPALFLGDRKSYARALATVAADSARGTSILSPETRPDLHQRLQNAAIDNSFNEQLIFFKTRPPRNVTAAFPEEARADSDRRRCGPAVPRTRGIHRRRANRLGDARCLYWRGVPSIVSPYRFSITLSSSTPNTLRARPELAKAVRTLVLSNPCADDAELLRLLPGLWDLDITLPPPNSPNAQADALVAAVRNLRTLRGLAVRKAAGTYLSQPAPRALLDALADAVYASAELTSTMLAFSLSADPALTRLASALSSAPALTTLRTPLPAAWSPAYLCVAANPALQRVCLGSEEASHSRLYFLSSTSSPSTMTSTASLPRMSDRRLSSPSPPYPSSSMPHSPSYKRARPILPTALFLYAARPHARLVGLIKAGTYICPNVGAGAGAGRKHSAPSLLRAFFSLPPTPSPALAHRAYLHPHHTTTPLSPTASLWAWHLQHFPRLSLSPYRLKLFSVSRHTYSPGRISLSALASTSLSILHRYTHRLIHDYVTTRHAPPPRFPREGGMYIKARCSPFSASLSFLAAPPWRASAP